MAALGDDVARVAMSHVYALAHDYYESRRVAGLRYQQSVWGETGDARDATTDPGDEERWATEEFRRRHPEISDAAVEALAWRYSLDNR